MHHRVTRNSAVVVMAQWIQQHGREPNTLECTASNGLFHYTTYRKCYGSYQGALNAAHGLLCAGSALLLQLIGQQTQPCLGCGISIRREAAHVRHCRRCRQRLFADGDGEPTGALSLNLYHEFWKSPLEDLISW